MRRLYLLNLFIFIIITSAFAQPRNLPQNIIRSRHEQQRSLNREKLKELAEIYHTKYSLERENAREIAKQKGWPVKKVFQTGGVVELLGFLQNGAPLYYQTQNINAARTISTDLVWPAGLSGLSLNGSGMLVGEWDAGGVLKTHQELRSRVTQGDNAVSTDSHSTHVAGTLIAAGISPQVKGMAFAADLLAYDWNYDLEEMAAAAADLLISNHSYGIVSGWEFDVLDDNKWVWYGDTRVSELEDYYFGFYSEITEDWDKVAKAAPYYLIVAAAGNDRNDNGPAAGVAYWLYDYAKDDYVLSNEPRNPDGQYDCISHASLAKNILSVGAVNDITTGYSDALQVAMTSFSAWGPADDGRIKPDLVANGVSLYSSINSSDNSYGTFSGTSMSSPNVAGSLILLQQHYKNSHDNNVMKSATLKALAIQSADEAGSNPGPDYRFGWGLMNTANAAEIISQTDNGHFIFENTLNNNSTYEFEFFADGSQPVKATLCWTDPAGSPGAAAVDSRTAKLVNDLDMRISEKADAFIQSQATPFMPFLLNPDSPDNAATNGDNSVDNVEQIIISQPKAGYYTLTVTHKGNLQNGFQDYSLVLSISGFQVRRKFEEIFDSPVVPAGWQVIDNDNSGNAFGYISSIEFERGPVLQPQAGSHFWYSNYTNANAFGRIDEWLISPQIKNIAYGDSLVFYAGAPGAQYDDSLRIFISTTTNQLSSFVNQLAYFRVDGPSGSWHRYAFDLAAFAGANIYIAVNYYIVDGGKSGANSDNVWIDHFIIKGGSGITIPVEFASFKGTYGNQQVRLVWETESETNNFGFQIQRQDKDLWKDVGFVRGQGTTARSAKYEFIDRPSDVANITLNYRLKQIDFDGTSAFSQISSVLISQPENIKLYANYPNPFNPETILHFQLDNLYTVQLAVYNLNGQLVKNLVNETRQAGHYFVAWNGTNEQGSLVPSGMYIAKFTARSDSKVVFEQTNKMILIR